MLNDRFLIIFFVAAVVNSAMAEMAVEGLISSLKYSRVLCYTCNHEDVPKHSLFTMQCQLNELQLPIF